MPKPPAAKTRMYKLTNPDPLRQHTARTIAAAAGCSVATISDLRTGRLTQVSEPLAHDIAAAVGATMDDLFEPTGLMAWERANAHKPKRGFTPTADDTSGERPQ